MADFATLFREAELVTLQRDEELQESFCNPLQGKRKVSYKFLNGAFGRIFNHLK
jgi:hypothetical protein